MIVSVGNTILDPEVPGKIILGLECIRAVNIAEIRNHSGEIDQGLLFYMELLGEEIHSGGFSLQKYERIKKIASAYAIYWIRYSFSDSEIILKQYENQFSYLTIFETKNMVEDYFDLRRDFVRKQSPIFQRKSGNFIKRNQISKILKSFRKSYQFKESTSLVDFLN